MKSVFFISSPFSISSNNGDSISLISSPSNLKSMSSLMTTPSWSASSKSKISPSLLFIFFFRILSDFFEIGRIFRFILMFSFQVIFCFYIFPLLLFLYSFYFYISHILNFSYFYISLISLIFISFLIINIPKISISQPKTSNKVHTSNLSISLCFLKFSFSL